MGLPVARLTDDDLKQAKPKDPKTCPLAILCNHLSEVSGHPEWITEVYRDKIVWVNAKTGERYDDAIDKRMTNVIKHYDETGEWIGPRSASNGNALDSKPVVVSTGPGVR